MFKRVCSFVFLGILLLMMAIGCSKRKMKIGFMMVDPESAVGEYKVYSEEINKGLILYLKKHPDFEKHIDIVRVYYERNKENVRKKFMELLNFYKVDLIIGPATSHPSQWVVDLAEENKIPLIMPLATVLELTKGKYYVWRFCANAYSFSYAIGWFVKMQLESKNVIIYYQKGDIYTEEVAKFVKDYLVQNGVKSIIVKEMIENKINFRKEAMFIKSRNPDCLIIISFPHLVERFVPVIRNVGYRGPILGDLAWHNEKLCKLLHTLKGSYYIFTFFSHVCVSDKETKEFVEAYKERYTVYPHFSSIVGYDLAGFLHKLYKNCPRIRREDIIETLRKITYEGLTGEVHYGESQEAGRKIIHIIEIKDGETRCIRTILTPPY